MTTAVCAMAPEGSETTPPDKPSPCSKEVAASIRHRSRHPADFRWSARKGTYAITVTVCLGLVIYSLVKLVIGVKNLNSCPLDPFLPIYLTASSSLLLVFLMVIAALVVKVNLDQGNNTGWPVQLMTLLYFYIHLVLHVAGCVCVFRTRLLARNLTTPTCDGDLLTFSLAVVILELTPLALVCLLAGLSLCQVVCAECRRQYRGVSASYDLPKLDYTGQSSSA